MNPKFFVAAVVVALVAILGAVALSGDLLVGGLTSNLSDSPESADILPIEVQLNDILIQHIDERAADIQIEFEVTNPNTKSVLLPFMSYHLYEGDVRIHAGEIGERLEAMVVGSNYITLLSGQSVTIRDDIGIKNTGNTPELWNALTTDTVEWRVTGEAVYSLSSVTAGGQNEIRFEFP